MFSHHNKTYVQNLGNIGLIVGNLSRLQASLVNMIIFCLSKLDYEDFYYLIYIFSSNDEACTCNISRAENLSPT